VAFIVMLAGAGVRGDEALAAQIQALNEAGGMSHEEAVKARALEVDILKAIESEKDPAKLREKLAPLIPKEKVDEVLQQLAYPWFRFFLEYDPGTDLRKVTCAVLALNGDKDTQVVSKQNLPAIHAALEAGGNKRFETVEFPGLNHLFQAAKTGGVGEYAEIEETMSPAVLEKIANWILHRP
jgi:pimeloyl-ACP methyl ester carboxylesterase